MWARFKQGLTKTSQKVRQGFSKFFRSTPPSGEDAQAMEEILLSTDMGVAMVDQIMMQLTSFRGDPEERHHKLRAYLVQLLLPYERSFIAPPLLLAVGVNGSGKTTTLGKLAWLWHNQGLQVRLVAADTFRMGAVEQLSLWALKSEARLTIGKDKDPASVVFQGVTQGIEEKDDVILVDTAGRLPNKEGLMDELTKIHRIINRLCPSRPYEIILVLDATIGQHALIQVERFRACLPVTGLIMNKMDGTAKGGILLNVTQSYALPIYGIGVGEQLEDFCAFSAQYYVDGLLEGTL